MLLMLVGSANMFLLPIIGRGQTGLFYFVYALAAAWNLIQQNPFVPDLFNELGQGNANSINKMA